MKYNSAVDTLEHIDKVRNLLLKVATLLEERGRVHDLSKLSTPEKELFDKYTPLLSSTEFGSDDYYEGLKNLQPALDHHYSKNSHHPQHYKDGINGMNLLDVIEMLVDWKASTERYKDGDVIKSIKHNQNRFGITQQLTQILLNTVKVL